MRQLNVSYKKALFYHLKGGVDHTAAWFSARRHFQTQTLIQQPRDASSDYSFMLPVTSWLIPHLLWIRQSFFCLLLALVISEAVNWLYWWKKKKRKQRIPGIAAVYILLYWIEEVSVLFVILWKNNLQQKQSAVTLNMNSTTSLIFFY